MPVVSAIPSRWGLLFTISVSSGLWKASTKASRNRVQNKGNQRLRHITGLGKSFPQDTVMLKIYVNSRGDWSSTQKRNPLRILTYFEPCLTQIIFEAKNSKQLGEYLGDRSYFLTFSQLFDVDGGRLLG